MATTLIEQKKSDQGQGDEKNPAKKIGKKQFQLLDDVHLDHDFKECFRHIPAGENSNTPDPEGILLAVINR
ncbi:hypothetical protein ACFL6N_04725 [Thermodesulfobacteriota bacterium]